MRLRPLCRRVHVSLPFALATGLGALSSLAGAGCGGDRYIVVGTARAPSACGFVEVDGKSDKSTRLTVHLEQLHPVDSLDPALHAYVVWFENGKDTPVRAGPLKYQPDERVGELKAEAPYRKFVVKVTAEANDTPSAPSAFVVADEQISTLD
jgi:hypothetical protein